MHVLLREDGLLDTMLLQVINNLLRTLLYTDSLNP